MADRKKIMSNSNERISFDHLTFNTGDLYRVEDLCLPKSVRHHFSGLDEPGVHAFPPILEDVQDLRIWMTRHSAMHYTFSILRKLPIVTCHACLATEASSAVWLHALSGHRETAELINQLSLPQSLARMVAETPPLAKPEGLFLTSHLQVGSMDPCISWIAGFDQCLYWHLWQKERSMPVPRGRITPPIC